MCKKVILNIIAVVLMGTGPFLMWLPGPQVLSWFGLALFIYANYDWLKKFKWFRKLDLKYKIWRIERKSQKREKHLKKKFEVSFSD